jgi:hypothetical protein
MMRVRAASEQLDISTIKGQWRKAYEAECGAQTNHSQSWDTGLNPPETSFLIMAGLAADREAPDV